MYQENVTALKKDAPIGVFDSGIGGLTVAREIMRQIPNEKIFDSVPVKKEVKAVVSGIYVLDVKGLHGKTEAAPEKKKGFFKRLVATAQEKAGAKPVK